MRPVGRVDDRALHAWYDAADLFVHPTRYQGSSLVTLEAMLHKRPVLATRAGGLPDKVVPGRTGWLTEPSTPSALTATLQQAFAERERWPAVRGGWTCFCLTRSSTGAYFSGASALCNGALTGR